MAISLERDLVQLLNDRSSVKVLATVDEDGTPRVVVKGSLHVDDDGNVVLLEGSEYSQTQRNLVRAIWFDRRVAINVKGADGRSFHVVGRPRRAVVSGPVFERHYLELRARLGDVDLSTVWIIEPERVEEKGRPARERAEADRLPLLHLDRIARPDGPTNPAEQPK